MKKNLDTTIKRTNFFQSLGPSLYVGSKLVLFSAFQRKTNSLSLNLNDSRRWFFLTISPQVKESGDLLIREFFVLREYYIESRIFCLRDPESSDLKCGIQLRNLETDYRLESGIQVSVRKNRNALP